MLHIQYVLKVCFLPVQCRLPAPEPQQRAACTDTYTWSWTTSPLTGTAPILSCNPAPNTQWQRYYHQSTVIHVCAWTQIVQLHIPASTSPLPFIHSFIHSFFIVPAAHLQSVAVVCSWHDDSFIIEENVRVSFQADGWGRVHLLSLP